MAKFKVEVEIDWLREDGTIDEQLQKSIEKSIIGKIEDTVMDRIEETAVNEAEKRIGIWINNYLSTLIKERKIPHVSKDGWDKKVEYITITELIGEKFDTVLNQTVDKDGCPTNRSYDKCGTRLDWLTGKQAKIYADEKVQDFVKNIKHDIEKYTSEKVKEEMMKQLTASLVSNIDFNKVFREGTEEVEHE